MLYPTELRGLKANQANYGAVLTIPRPTLPPGGAGGYPGGAPSRMLGPPQVISGVVDTFVIA